MRAAVAAYFDSEEAHSQAASARAEQQGSALQGLPLAAKSGFLAKDARMLLRETAAKLVCDTFPRCHLACLITVLHAAAGPCGASHRGLMHAASRDRTPKHLPTV
jgi:hypothetical protein